MWRERESGVRVWRGRGMTGLCDLAHLFSCSRLASERRNGRGFASWTSGLLAVDKVDKDKPYVGCVICVVRMAPTPSVSGC